MSRRQWIIAAIVAVVVVGGLVFWAFARSDDGSGVADPDPTGSSPGTSASATDSPAPTGSATSPSPTETTGNPSPTETSTTSPTPSVSGSLAPDGKPQVTVDTPTPGEHSNIPVHATGTAVAPGGVARYEILKKGKLFTNGPLYVSKNAPARGHWETDIELPLGKYTLVVFVESQTDGHRIAQTEVPFYAG